MRQESRNNLKQTGTQRQGQEQQNERLNPMEQPEHEQVSLDNDELEQKGRGNQEGREELGQERTTERSDRRL